MQDDLIVVAGAGGFIGGHLVADLLRQGHARIRAVDCKPLYSWWQLFPDVENCRLDLRRREHCNRALRGAAVVYDLAADMGGMGFIENHKALCMLSVLINTHLVLAARQHRVRRYFYASSACVYAADKQASHAAVPLKEEDAYPALPEDGYGWEKLFGERMCRHFREDFGLATRLARYHNVYGPCFDAETEILTRMGFKGFPELTSEDEVATLNPESGFLEYHKPLAIQNYYYQGPMHRIENQRVDLLITPDHSVYLATRRNNICISPFRFARIKDTGDDATLYFRRDARWLGEDCDHFRVSEVLGADGRPLLGKNGGEKAVSADIWLRFLGWYLSEGSAFQTDANYVVAITQHDPAVRNEIAGVIREMGYYPYINGKDVRVFSKQLHDYVKQFGGAHDRFIPREVMELPPEKLSVLVETLMRGDGGKVRGRYSSVSARLANDFQELVIKLGYGSQVSTEVLKGGRTTYRVHFGSDVVHRIQREHRSVLESWSGRVYDVKVPNHVILVRRRGKTVWSGNCGSWTGGREKAPAAICRKVAEAKLSGRDEIEIWGDGRQARSFMYIDDCLKGTQLILHSDVVEPLNLGSDELVTIDGLVDLVEDIAGVKLRRRYNLTAPKGVNGRNSDNTRIRALLGWAPGTRLRDGLERTYAWVYDQVAASRLTGRNEAPSGAVAAAGHPAYSRVRR
jgi:nucleoside-diphosphate-sugar epimerase